MARIITSGFEWKVDSGGTGAFQIDGAISSGTWTSDTTNMRSGAVAAATTLVSGATSSRSFVFGGNLGTTYFQRIYFRKSANPGTNGRMVLSFSGGVRHGLLLNTDGTLSLVYNLSTVIGSASAVLADNVYYMLEISERNEASGTQTSSEARLEGVTFASETLASRAVTAPSSFNVGAIDLNTHTGTVAYLFDDFAVNDGIGSSQTTFPGSGKIVLLRPISDNATGANWVEGAGGTGSLFAAVDNTPPVGVALASGTNASQIKNVTKDTTGNYDANMTTYTTAGIVTQDTINVVFPHWNLGSSASVTISHGMLLVSNPVANAGVEATTLPSGIAGTYPSNWSWQTPANQIVYGPSVTVGTSPVMRVGKRTSSTSSAMSDAMGIYVDYTSAPPDLGLGLSVT